MCALSVANIFRVNDKKLFLKFFLFGNFQDAGQKKLILLKGADYYLPINASFSFF
jgi:hypothetical protein